MIFTSIGPRSLIFSTTHTSRKTCIEPLILIALIVLFRISAIFADFARPVQPSVGELNFHGYAYLVLLCYKVDTSVSIYLALATSGQYVEDDEPPATGFLPSTCASASLSGRSDPGRWACRSRC